MSRFALFTASSLATIGHAATFALAVSILAIRRR